MDRLVKSLSFILMPLFILSGVGFSLWRHETPESAVISSDRGDNILRLVDSPPSLPGGLMHILLVPDDPVLWALLITVWISALVCTMRLCNLWRGFVRISGGSAPDGAGQSDFLMFRRPGPRMESGWAAFGLPLALAAGAIWPWVTQKTPLLGFLLACAIFAGLMTSALTRPGGRNRRLESISAIGVLAGWTTLAVSVALAALLVDLAGLSQTHAALIALLFCAICATRVQLRMGCPLAYSVTIIWALTGIALATMNSNLQVAIAAAIAILAVVGALVRVAS